MKYNADSSPFTVCTLTFPEHLNKQGCLTTKTMAWFKQLSPHHGSEQRANTTGALSKLHSIEAKDQCPSCTNRLRRTQTSPRMSKRQKKCSKTTEIIKFLGTTNFLGRDEIHNSLLNNPVQPCSSKPPQALVCSCQSLDM